MKSADFDRWLSASLHRRPEPRIPSDLASRAMARARRQQSARYLTAFARIWGTLTLAAGLLIAVVASSWTWDAISRSAQITTGTDEEVVATLLLVLGTAVSTVFLGADTE